MSIVKNYNEFNIITGIKCNIDIATARDKNIYNWYLANRNQKQGYEFTNVPNGTFLESDIGYYRKFGLNFDPSIKAVLNHERYYIIIFEESDLYNVKEHVEEYSRLNLPSNTIPTFFFINKHYDKSNISELAQDIYRVKSVYPALQCKNNVSLLNDINANIELVKESLAEYEEYKHFNLVDITSRIMDFRNLMLKTEGKDVVNEFIKLCDSIAVECDSNSLIYTTLSNNYQLYFFAYLKYHYNLNCHIDFAKLEMFMAIYLKQFFDKTTMLAEDQIKYLLHYPTLTCKLTGYGIYANIVLSSSLTSKVSYCPISDISKTSLSSVQVDLSKVTVLPLLDFYGLTTDFNFDVITSSDIDIYTNLPREGTQAYGVIKAIQSEHNRLKQDLTKLEQAIGLTDRVCDVFNTFIFYLDDDEATEPMIGYMHNLDFNADTAVVQLQEDAKIFEGHISFENFYDYIPLEFLMDSNEIEEMLIDRIYESTGKRLEIKKPLKLTDKSAIPYSELYTRSFQSNPIEDWGKFMEIGKYCSYSRGFREGTLNAILAKVPLRNLRSKSDFISAFGGMHPLVSNQLELTGEMLARGVDNIV